MTTSDRESPAKRRKVRKGTQSCWECRRRKVRCIFAAPTDATCKNCVRRKTACVSQEECEEPVSTTSFHENELATPISRSEELVEQLTTPQNLRGNRQDRSSSNDAGYIDGFCAVFTPSSEGTFNGTAGSVQPSLVADRYKLCKEARYETLNQRLISVWPTERELEIIAALPVGMSSHLHNNISRPCCSQVELTTDEILRLPSPTSHPVLVARNSLRLGTFLQGVLPSSLKAMEAQGFSPDQVMHRIVDIAITCVTTQDEFLDSVEAVECITLEAMFQNYSGNMHRAWKATRRAITVAQSMAIHRGISSPSLRFLESRARAQADLDYLTFRLAEMDAYLSVMLGLPQSSLDTRRITSDEALAACSPTERMQRMHYMALNRIIPRSSSDTENLSETDDIDKLIRKAAAEMPPRWWSIPTFVDATQTANDMLRLMLQLSHYHLILRLHLPYLLNTSSDRRFDYSKAVAVNTGREILTRFIAFRTNNTANYYCRGSDFLSFISTTILCVAHTINSSSIANNVQAPDRPLTGFESLAHARLSDRGLMEHALEIIENTQDGPMDAIARKISRIMRDLLAIEESASEGALYDARVSAGRDEELECETTPGTRERAMRVHIPHFGSIEFVKGTVVRSANDAGGRAVDWPISEIGAQNLGYPTDGMPDLSVSDETPRQVLQETALDLSMDDVGDWNWDLQGVDVALFDGLFSGSTMCGSSF